MHEARSLSCLNARPSRAPSSAYDNPVPRLHRDASLSRCPHAQGQVPDHRLAAIVRFRSRPTHRGVAPSPKPAEPTSPAHTLSRAQPRRSRSAGGAAHAASGSCPLPLGQLEKLTITGLPCQALSTPAARGQMPPGALAPARIRATATSRLYYKSRSPSSVPLARDWGDYRPPRPRTRNSTRRSLR